MTTSCTVQPRRVDKPWGWELVWALTEHYCGKLLFVRAGEALSLQYHEQKDESWLIQSGLARIELGRAGGGELAEEVVGPGAAFHYTPHTVHRITAVEPCGQSARIQNPLTRMTVSAARNPVHNAGTG